MDNWLPFHEGEVAIQKHLGVHERVAAIGKRLIRDHLTDEHAEFFPQLPTLLVGSRDGQGRMWASMFAREPGFIQTAGPRRVKVNARPVAGDPLGEAITPGTRLGLLGLQFETRRRNRISATVAEVDRNGFVLDVNQTYGNCPKYIQTRAAQLVDSRPAPPEYAIELGPADQAIIQQADTFFIATGVEDAARDVRAGNDVSHRGGRPGFVRVQGNTLTWPDFVGNFLFNTLGNLQIDPRAGLLFVDFERGDTLQLSGQAQVIWDAPYQSGFAGAERFVRFEVEQVIRIRDAMPLRWEFDQASPFNGRTGVWSEVSTQDIS